MEGTRPDVQKCKILGPCTGGSEYNSTTYIMPYKQEAQSSKSSPYNSMHEAAK